MVANQTVRHEIEDDSRRCYSCMDLRKLPQQFATNIGSRTSLTVFPNQLSPCSSVVQVATILSEVEQGTLQVATMTSPCLQTLASPSAAANLPATVIAASIAR